MTQLQHKTIDEMMRQGLHNQLYSAELCWLNHKKFQLDGFIHISRLLNDLINKSNRQI